ncbi:MAG: LamG domain-containing protein, partial [Hymenobacter sp.]
MTKKYFTHHLGRAPQLLFGAGLGLLAAAPSLVQAQMSPAYTLPLNGTTQYGLVPNTPTLEIATGTVEMWVKPNWAPGSYNGANPCLIGERTVDNANTRFSLHLRDDLTGLGIWNGSYFMTVNYAFTQGQWYHIAAVLKAGATDFYVNGTYVNSTSNGINTGVSSTKLCLGAAAAIDTRERFKGELDEVRVWSTQRTAAQISANKSTSVAANSAGLVAYYPIEQNTTDISNAKTALLKDYGTSSFHGQVYNYWVPVITGISPASGVV